MKWGYKVEVLGSMLEKKGYPHVAVCLVVPGQQFPLRPVRDLPPCHQDDIGGH